MKTGKKINGIIYAMALLVLAVPAIAAAEDATIEKAWDLFNKEQHTESLAVCKKLLKQYADDAEKTPAILRLMSLNYDHAAAKSKKADDELNAKAAMERIIKDYPASSHAAEAYHYLGEIYSGNVPVKIETDCSKALPMYDKAIEKAGEKWIKESSYKGIERCNKKEAKEEVKNDAGKNSQAGTAALRPEQRAFGSSSVGRNAARPQVPETLTTAGAADASYTGLVPGYRGTAIPVRGDQLLYVKKGNRVDVLVTFDAATGQKVREKVTATILQNVIVINVFKPEKIEEMGAVEILCNPNEAQYVALSQAQGNVHIAVRAPGDVEMRPMEMASFRKLMK